MNRRISCLEKIFHAVCIIASVSLITSCKLMLLESKLDRESREFFSTVRYLISSEEKKIFLELPPSEREKFIKEFWERRDPTPETEENEFKTEYLNKIEKANLLFRGGGKLGFIQDRGRIYILLGPPDERYTEPESEGAAARSTEVWLYYKNYKPSFRLDFIDYSGDGDYNLVPPTTYVLYQINMAQQKLHNPENFGHELFDFNLQLRKKEAKGLFVQIEIPFKNIWFRGEEKRLETILFVSFEVFDSRDEKVWEYQRNYDISLTEEEALTMLGKSYLIEIPLNLEEGTYKAEIALENKVEEQQRKKKISFTISQ